MKDTSRRAELQSLRLMIEACCDRAEDVGEPMLKYLLEMVLLEVTHLLGRPAAPIRSTNGRG